MRREERKRKERDLLHDLIIKGCLKDDIFEKWQHDTHRQKSAFYDRLDELSEEDRVCYETLPDRRMLDIEILNEIIINIEDSDGLYQADLMGRNPELASRLTKDELCNWWCEKYEATPFAFDVYWRALRKEIRDLVADQPKEG
jgi:hypothetical protein